MSLSIIRLLLTMSFDFFLKTSEENKHLALYHSNYHWILNHLEDGAAHFAAFEAFCNDEDNVDFPPSENVDGIVWIREVVKAFSKEVDISDALHHSHLGKVTFDKTTSNDKFMFCTLKPIMSLLKSISVTSVDNIAADFIAKAEPFTTELLASVKKKQENEINQDEFSVARCEYDENMTLLISELINKIKTSQQIFHLTSNEDKENIIQLPNEQVPSPMFEDNVLWVTDQLELKQELLADENLPHNLLSQLEDSRNYFNTPQEHHRIKKLTGLYHECSVDPFNHPLNETCIMMSFAIEKSDTLPMVQPGMFNGGYYDLWAYWNSNNGFGQTVRLDNGKKGVPEALIKMNECMKYLFNEPSTSFATYLEVEQRFTNKVDIATIVIERTKELMANEQAYKPTLKESL